MTVGNIPTKAIEEELAAGSVVHEDLVVGSGRAVLDVSMCSGMYGFSVLGNVPFQFARARTVS